MKTPAEVAEEHWKYIESLLEIHSVDLSIRTASEFHYKSAFIHGWEHAMQAWGIGGEHDTKINHQAVAERKRI